MAEDKEKSRQLKLRFFNIVIHPSDKHKEQCYIDLFDKIFEQGKTYETGGDRRTKIRTYSKTKNTICFTLVNYVTLEENGWYDEKQDNMIEYKVDPNVHPNCKEWNLYFIPSKHRLAVEVKKGVSWAQLRQYMSKTLQDAGDALGYDEVRFTQETSKECIDEIFALDSINTLEIEVSYSNNDTNDITAQLIDDEFKKSNVSTIKAKAVSSKGNPIILAKDKGVLPSLVKLTQHNGHAKAIGKMGDRPKTINTNDYPMERKLTKVKTGNLLDKVFQAVSSIF